MDIETLHKLREHFDAKRKGWIFKLGFSKRNDMHKWTKNMMFAFVLDEYQDLLENGTVVWAHRVHFDFRLLRRNIYPGPVSVLFGTDENCNDVALLKVYADQLSDYDEEEPPQPSELSNLAKKYYTLNEPYFQEWLPNSATGGFKLCYTTLLVHRPTIPDGTLNQHWFPILVNPGKSKASAILPYRYWLPSMVKAWAAKKTEKA